VNGPLPAGYEMFVVGTAAVATQPSYFSFVRDAILRFGDLYGSAAAQPGIELRGRGTAYVIEAPGGRWVVRRYFRGGQVARLVKDRYLRVGEPRPFRELRVSATARSRGVATPEVTAAVVYASGPAYRADLATRFVADSVDLVALTFDTPGAKLAPAWRATGELIRRLAAAGIQHADLNMKNVLITEAGDQPRAWVLDLDRAEVREKGRADAEVMFARLKRSIAKWERLRGPVDPALHIELARGLRG